MHGVWRLEIMVTLGIGQAHRRPKLPVHDVPDFLVPLTHSSPPLQSRLLPKHPKPTSSSSSSSSSYTIYSFFLPSTSESFLSFSSPTLLLLPAFSKPQPTPTPRLTQLFSTSLILHSSLQKTRSLNFFLHWISLSKIFPPTVDKLREIRTNSQKCECSGVREKRGDGAHPSTFGQEEDPRVFTRPHHAVTERGNLLLLGIFGAFAAVF